MRNVNAAFVQDHFSDLAEEKAEVAKAKAESDWADFVKSEEIGAAWFDKSLWGNRV